MAHGNALTFYRIVRNSPEMWQDLRACPDTETMIAKLQTLSAAQGIALSREQIATGLADIGTVIAEASGDDALTDDELELVAAGAVDNGNKNRLNA